MTGPSRRFALSAILGLLVLAGPLAGGAEAQYFGRNKVQYRTFDFKILKTDHFDIYFYPEERDVAEQAGRMAERWYERYSTLLDHQLSGRQVLILYACHTHFEQTNAIAGNIGEGTGGVTEYLKRRIVLPLAGPLAETDHVIGHELVHAFQYDIGRGARGGSGLVDPAVGRLPLWFIEGMAEYLSIGSIDPNTAMWIRDAAENKKFPTIQKLNNPDYFPYRFGQAFWAYVGGRWGDRRVGDVFKSAAVTGDADRAIERVLGVAEDTLSMEWKKSVMDWYEPVAATTTPPESVGRKLFAEKKGRGRLNVAPALSPDGKHLVFLSERDLFSIEMFLADAETGRIIKRLTRTAVDPHFQSLEFIESSGSFSPDGHRFAFAAVSKGIPVLTVIDPDHPNHEHEIPLPAFDQILNPTWAPDGDRICVSAMVGGATDLFIVDVATGAVRRLTNDLYADLAPSWSPDGKHIAFVTDRFTTNLDDLDYGRERIALIDPANGSLEEVPGLPHAKNIDPQWSSDGKELYFISDGNGISNLYRVALDGGKIQRITNVRTGVSGITDLSPALTVARAADRAVVSVFEKDGFVLYAIDDLSHAPGQAPTLIARATPPAKPAEEAGPPVPAVTPPAGTEAKSATAPEAEKTVAEQPAEEKATEAEKPAESEKPTEAKTAAATKPGAEATKPPTETKSPVENGTPAAESPPAKTSATVAHASRRGPASTGAQAEGAVRLGGLPTPPSTGFEPDALPPILRDSVVVNEFPSEPRRGLANPSGFTRADYKPGLSLDYVAQPTVGVAAGTNGVAFGGGTTLYWSDMLGNHNLATLLQVNNDGGNFLNNVAAVAAYQNLSTRWNWGMIAGQIPYLTSGYDYQDGYLPSGEPIRTWREIRYWEIDRQLTGMVSYPFNQVQRVEFSGGYRNIDFTSQVDSKVYSLRTGDLLSEQNNGKAADDTLKALNLFSTSAALVYDTSVFGGTSPVLGQSWRFELDPTVGNVNYVGVLADYRRYMPLVRPFTLAVRGLHFGRYGSGGEDPRLTELFLGYPWLIRGYNNESFSASEVVDINGNTRRAFERLFGSRMVVGNAELRIPVFGALGIVYSPAMPPVELAPFYDAGVAWTATDKASFLGGSRDLVTSYGLASRVNLFGIAVAEFDFVHPNDRPGKGWYWEFNLQPGF